MLRPILASSLVALIAATPALADRFEAPADITAVTIYPEGASVTRQVIVDVPAGTHEVVVPGLPENTYADALRVTPSDGVRIGAVSLATGRQPVTDDTPSAEVETAKAEVERLEQVLRDHDTKISMIRLRVAAAEEQVAFLRGLGNQDGLAAASPDDIRALAQLVGSEVLAAQQSALEAEVEAQAALRARADDAELLDKARQALAALTAPVDQGAVLTLTVQTETDGPVTLDISTIVSEAMWRPTYDLRLTRGDTPTLEIDRNVLVTQYSGEDWDGVALTLSTARPGEQSAAGEVYGIPRRIISEVELDRARGADVSALGGMAEPAMEMAPVVVMEERGMTANFQGANVTYTYSGSVTIRDGVDDLRLTLDTQTVTPEIWAAAAPLGDDSAYMVAEMTNTTGEVILPGQALLIADGSLVGFTDLPLVAAGDDTKIGFGVIDGIRLTRIVPNRTEGDIGVISRSNQQTETAVITVENLTGETWPIRLRDRTYYSDQDDLVVDYTASLPVTVEAPEGRRGVLEWQFDLGAGEEQEITLESSLTWPTGYVLQ
ncbi:DUF4139 domain-containing protein [Octadecabacter sp. R77987]|uniref:DUF4139 domain-containing protein n=1 Tax=Octadecabacter sp. R77987 TaxID=3093874 RepID=UPI00366B106B